jgi:hypothetical protein
VRRRTPTSVAASYSPPSSPRTQPQSSGKHRPSQICGRTKRPVTHRNYAAVLDRVPTDVVKMSFPIAAVTNRALPEAPLPYAGFPAPPAQDAFRVARPQIMSLRYLPFDGRPAGRVIRVPRRHGPGAMRMIEEQDPGIDDAGPRLPRPLTAFPQSPAHGWLGEKGRRSVLKAHGGEVCATAKISTAIVRHRPVTLAGDRTVRCTRRTLHSPDMTLGPRIIARATRQRTGGIHEHELLGRFDDRQPSTQCHRLFGQEGEFNQAWHAVQTVSFLSGMIKTALQMADSLGTCRTLTSTMGRGW